MTRGPARAFVTGAASGLGAATVRGLVARGYRVVAFDRDGPRLEAVATELGAIPVVGDVTDEGDLARGLTTGVDAGPLRVVVAAAGIGMAMRTLARDGVPHDLEVFRRVVEVNLVGTFNTFRLAAAVLARAPLDGESRGVMVATSSAAATEGQVGQVAYAASKAGISGFILPMARDLAPVGIRVLAVAPGVFDTPLMALLPPEARMALAEAVVHPRRLGRADEFADLVLALVDATYLNGTTVRLDGGLRLR